MISKVCVSNKRVYYYFLTLIEIEEATDEVSFKKEILLYFHVIAISQTKLLSPLFLLFLFTLNAKNSAAAT